MKQSNQAYYDDFSATYEDGRRDGYHALIDRLEVDLARDYIEGKRVLEAGCGTGLILEQLQRHAREAVGLDLSPGMLEKAREKGLQVVQGSVTEVPFPDASFDVVCSFKVLPHVQEIEVALAELARVLRPGGTLLAEFYNPLSIRYLIKRLKPPTQVGSGHDEAVFTRYDRLADVKRHLPPSMAFERVRGVRVFTPASHFHRIPGVSSALEWLEWRSCDAPLLRHFGGFMIVVARKADH